ncbi:CG13704 [Drosophila busckii]|uniref:CG13704 n=1 Tax=Drosophila busckii TaxID=30019 RepID=A0A0M4EFL2_DROBS|nr:CG13704 [Drosophila busckii]
MKLAKKYSSYLLICLVLLACCMQEADATRRVNRGRRTLTRRYYGKSIANQFMPSLIYFCFAVGTAIPGWAVIVCVAVGELILGAALYFALYKVILDKEPDHASTYTPAKTHDPTPSVPMPQPTPQPAPQPVQPAPSHATAIV